MFAPRPMAMNENWILWALVLAFNVVWLQAIVTWFAKTLMISTRTKIILWSAVVATILAATLGLWLSTSLDPAQSDAGWAIMGIGDGLGLLLGIVLALFALKAMRNHKDIDVSS
jgi:uncharacterized membrane protein